MNYNVKKILVVIGGFLLMFNYGLYTSTIGYFTVPVTEALGISRAAFSSINSIQLFVGVICTPLLVKWLLPKIGQIKLILVAAVACAVGFIGFSISKNIMVFYVFAVLTGIFYVAHTTIAMSNAIQKWFPVNNGTPMGICMAGSNGCTIILGTFMPAFIQKNGWSSGYVIQAVLCIVMAVIGSILIKGNPNDYEGAPEKVEVAVGNSADAQEETGITFKEALRKPVFYCFLIAAFITAYLCIFVSHVAAFFSDLGVSPELAGAVLALVSTVILVSKIGLGVIKDILGMRASIVLAMTCYALGFILLRFNNPVALYTGIVVLGIGMATANVFNPLVAKEAFGSKDFSQIFSVVNSASILGGGLGGIIWGWIFDTTGSYVPGMTIAPILVVFAAVTMFVMAKPRAKKVIKA